MGVEGREGYIDGFSEAFLTVLLWFRVMMGIPRRGMGFVVCIAEGESQTRTRVR